MNFCINWEANGSFDGHHRTSLREVFPRCPREARRCSAMVVEGELLVAHIRRKDARGSPPTVLGFQPAALVDHVARVDWSLLEQIPGDRGGSQQVVNSLLLFPLNLRCSFVFSFYLCVSFRLISCFLFYCVLLLCLFSFF